MSQSTEPGVLALTLAAIFQRLERLEQAAGISGNVPADDELDALLANDDEEGERR